MSHSPLSARERYEKLVATCQRKITYLSKTTATNAATALGWKGLDVEPYPCRICGAWHLTHAVSPGNADQQTTQGGDQCRAAS